MTEIDSNTFHPLEKTVLKNLVKKKSINLDELSTASGLNIDQIRRSVEWLKEKKLITVKSVETKSYSLGEEGKKVLNVGLPETRLLKTIESNNNKITLRELSENKSFEGNELSAALGYARAQKLINISKEGNDTIVTVVSKIDQKLEQNFLQKLLNSVESENISKDEAILLKSFLRRPDFIIINSIKESRIELSETGLRIAPTVEISDEVDNLTPDLIVSGNWKTSKIRPLNLNSPVPEIFSGRKHPMQLFIDEVKEIFTSLGFEEIQGPIIQSCFWNFDSLFTPQDHPAREIQDTFYIEDSTIDNVATQETISNVSSAHETGGNTGSKGWRYKWNSELSKNVVMRTHTTAITIKYLADHTPDDAKVFSIGKVFRNEKVTFKNLVEFNQIEGIVVGEKVTLRDMMGLLTKFYEKLGLHKVKFWPSFFPYTEPSLQSMVYHEGLGRWVELAGMGIFRPEVTIPLGIKHPVLAWGGGLERLVMLKYGIDDSRKLYENDLDWLRRFSLCQ